MTDVTSTITELIINSISQRSNLLDSFVITYATIVASLYRLVGVEFGKFIECPIDKLLTCLVAAHFVQTVIEMFETEHKKYRKAKQQTIDDEQEGYKETRNLLTLILELYNFQVISCILVYDIVRMLISELDESNVELLLRIIRSEYPYYIRLTIILIFIFRSCWS